MKKEKAFFERQFDTEGFTWEEMTRRSEGVMAYRRRAHKEKDDAVVILNVTPMPRHDFPIWLNGKKKWKEVFNTDDKKYYGSGNVFNPDISTMLVDKEQKRYELKLHLPPLAAIILM